MFQKSILFVLLAFTMSLSAQQNNPKNRVGLDYVTSLKILMNGINSGDISEINQEVIDKYKGLIPLDVTLNSDFATRILSNIRNSEVSIAELVDQMSITQASKTILLEMIRNDSKKTGAEYQEMIVPFVDVISAANIPQGEKDLLHSFAAVSFHLNSPENLDISRSTDPCEISGPDGSGPASNSECITLGAIVGGIVGFPICGLPCALGGALVGGIITAIAVK